MTFTKKQNDDLCVAAGIEGHRRGCLCDGQWCHSPDFCNERVYPDLLTAEGFLILWKALSDLGYNVKLYTKQKYTTTAFVGNDDHSRKLTTNVMDLPNVLFECAAKLLGVSLV